jgi:hypothetical protein
MAAMGVSPTPSPMLAGPMVNRFRPVGSDYTPQQLSTPIRQLQQQNIPQNVVPIRPTDATQAGMGTVGLRMREQPSLIDIIDSREGTYGVSQDYRDFSPMMGTLADMAGDQPVYDESVVTDMPSRPVFDLPSYSTSMPDVSQTLPADTQLSMLDDAMPTTIGPVAPAPFEEASFTPPVDYSQTLVDAGMAEVVDAVPGVSVAPSMQGVDYSQALADIDIDPATAGMAEVYTAGSDFFGGGVDAPFDFVDTSRTQDQIDDISRHGGLTFGVPVWTGRLSDLATYIPSQPIREMIRDQHDNIGDFLGDDTTTDKLQDLVNNQIAIDIKTANPAMDLTTRLQNKKEFEDNPNTVYDKDSLTAMVALAKKDYYKSEKQVQEAINEIKSGVDTFKDIPAVVPTVAVSKDRQRKDLKAAAAARRKDKLAGQKRAAAATRRFNALKAKQDKADKARQVRDEKTRKAQQKSAKALLDKVSSSDRHGFSERDIARAIEISTEMDTFAFGGDWGSAEALAEANLGYAEETGLGGGWSVG